MIEAAFTQAIHKKLPAHIYKWKINDNLQGGVPDAFYRNLQSSNGNPMWIEYKLIKELPKRDDTAIVPKLTPQQLYWLKTAHKCGEKAVVVVGCESLRTRSGVKSIILTKPDTWENGILKNDFKANALSYDEVASYIERTTSDVTIRHL